MFSFFFFWHSKKQNKPQKKFLSAEEAHGCCCCCCCVVFQASFSDMYIGYTSTLASFLSLEFNRLNQSEDSEKTQVGHSAGASLQTSIFFFILLFRLLLPVLHLAECSGGEGGNETALAAAGACDPHTQLPEPHSGEPPAHQGAPVSHSSSADPQNLIEIANPAHTGSKFWTFAIMGPYIMNTCSQSANQYDVTVWTNYNKTTKNKMTKT